MKTDELIAALAADHVVDAGFAPRALRRGAVAVAASAALFYALFGLRGGLASPPVMAATAMKLVYTLSIALSATVVAARLARPGGARRAALAPLLVPALALAALVAFDLSRHGAADWTTRLLGQTSLVCSPLIVSLSLLPLAALVSAMRSGAPERLRLAGALAGCAAAGLGASVYALHCADDSPLFVAAWYSLAVLLVAAGGAACARLLRW